MKTKILLLSTALTLLLASCTNTWYVSSTEYDDVYYMSSDRAQLAVVEEEKDSEQPYGRTNYVSNNAERNQRIYDNPAAAYDEDDFYFSRRIRRFHQANTNSWRYFDPYFSNDLFFVMGTPAWNRWNQLGWYSWNRPRFGASWAFNSWNDPFFGPNMGMGFNNFGFNTFGFNSFNSFNYYNPWVAAYYGYDPNFGFAGMGMDPFWGWNNPYGFNNPYFSIYNGCPTTFNSIAGYNAFTNARNRSRVRAQYNGSGALASQTNFNRTKRNATSVSDPSRRPVARPTASTTQQYLRPMNQEERIARVASRSQTQTRNQSANRAQTGASRVFTRPSRNANSSANRNRIASRPQQSSRYGTSSQRPTGRVFTRPSASQQRTSTRPSTRTFNRTNSSSQRSAYSRPNSSSNSRRSFSQPRTQQRSSFQRSSSSSRSSSSRSSSSRPASRPRSNRN